jgi:HAD superfamily hydrolase (TIGR01549 family)
MVSTFLFDLDLTLVDSSAVEAWRNARMWTRVRANMGLITAFDVATDSAPHEIPGLLRERGYRVGVVTSSPRWYAEQVLEQFGVEVDVLVAYDDTTEHKPDPAPIQRALELLGRNAADACYVGNDPVDVEASYHAGVFSVVVGWGIGSAERMASGAADLLIYKPELLLRPERFLQRRYVAEVASEELEPLLHRGSILPCGGHVEQYALGRYFARADPRHAESALSAKILEFKNSDEPAELFAPALSAFFARIDWTPDYVVPVPPKPSQARNRFRVLLEDSDVDFPEDVEVLTDGLRCIKEVGNYKAMNAVERADAIDGAFEVTDTVSGRVLLLDDALTTGETTRECARVLMAGGAAEVRVLGLAKDQHAFARKTCSACNRTMKIRVNGTTGERFWGCSGYPDHCRHTENL